MLAGQAITEVQSASTGEVAKTAQQIIGYHDIISLLNDEVSLQLCCENIAKKTRHYAKKQISWFKKESCFLALESQKIDELLPGIASI